MGLKESLERERMEELEAAETRNYYRRMLEEVGMQDGDPERVYQLTLPVKLLPEGQAMIDEFVELCPAKAWKRFPEKADRAAASCRWLLPGLHFPR